MAEDARDKGARDNFLGKIEDLRASRIPEGVKAFLAGERPP